MTTIRCVMPGFSPYALHPTRCDGVTLTPRATPALQPRFDSWILSLFHFSIFSRLKRPPNLDLDPTRRLLSPRPAPGSRRRRWEGAARGWPPPAGVGRWAAPALLWLESPSGRTPAPAKTTASTSGACADSAAGSATPTPTSR